MTCTHEFHARHDDGDTRYGFSQTSDGWKWEVCYERMDEPDANELGDF